MDIHYRQQIEGSPVVRFVAKAWVALMDMKQWDSSSVLVSGNLQCVYATENKKVVGCLTFHVDDAQAVINIAYVVPTHRGKGVYRQLHDAFTDQARKQKAKKLVNICYPTNTPIREAVKKLGYALELEHWVKKL